MKTDTIHTYHKLLQRQLRKIEDPDLKANREFQQFIQSVNDSYGAYDRDRELSEHAFLLSQEDYEEINNKLRKEIELRNLSVRKIKETIRQMHLHQEAYETPSGNDLLGILTFLNTEIEKRQQAEADLFIAKEAAEKANEAKSDFLSVMSHEIRTPLHAVLGMTHVLLNNDPRKDQVDNLKALKISADNLLVLVNDILDFNKIEAGKLELENEAFSLSDLLDSVVTAHMVAASEKENSLNLSIDPILPDYFIGDSARLGQVLNNLVGNAVKFTSKGSVDLWLIVTERMKGKVKVNISVKDTGIGISGENLANLFQPFQQATSSISRKFGGTGLGLAISQKILALMDSKIAVESTLGIGSQFSFELTLPITEVKSTDVKKIENLAPCLEGKKILLVEDTHFNVLYARQLLKGWCLEVEVAENGLIAVEKIYEGKYDLVLMDLQMPVMDGFSATEEIRKFNEEVPIIALTASASSSIKDKVLEVGMQDYVTKPFNPDIFLQKLTKYLS